MEQIHEDLDAQKLNIEQILTPNKIIDNIEMFDSTV